MVVYTHKDPERLMANLAGERIHRVADLEVYAFDRTLMAALAARLDRRMAFALGVSDGELFVSVGPDTLTGVVRSVGRARAR